MSIIILENAIQALINAQGCVWVRCVAKEAGIFAEVVMLRLILVQNVLIDLH